jgi:hypothetical protein
MQLSFRTLSSFTSILCFLLALVWGFFPEVLLAIWSIGYSEGTGVVARRSAVLFAALGVMFYLLRNAPPSAARSALSNGFIVGCFGLAALFVFAPGLGFVLARRVTVELGETLG